MSGRNVGLVVLIILAGLLVTSYHQGPLQSWRWVGRDLGEGVRAAIGHPERLKDIRAVRPWEHWRITECSTRELDAAGLAALVIDNPTGQVTVASSPGAGSVHLDVIRYEATWYDSREVERVVTVRTKVYPAECFPTGVLGHVLLRVPARTGRRVPEVRLLRPQAAQLALATTRAGGTLTLQVTGTEAAWEQSRLDLHLVVPKDLALRIREVSGQAAVQDVSGPLQVQSVSGDINLNGGSSVRATSVSGGIRLRGAAGKVSVTSTSGDLQLEGLSGPVTATTLSGDLRLLDYRGAEAGLRTTTGTAFVSISRPFGGKLFAQAVSGDLSVQLPAGSNCSTDLASLSGKVSYGLPGSRDIVDEHKVRGRLGSGRGRVQLRTLSGDIDLWEYVPE